MTISAASPKLDTLQSIQVADGLEILLPPAGPVARGMAYLLDGIFITITIFAINLSLILAGVFAGMGSALSLSHGVGLLIYFVLEWGYHAFFESSKHGASPGKRIMGLSVVRTNGVRLTFRDAIIRNLVRTADAAPLSFGVVGCACMLATKRFQRLGDLAADALVIYNPTRRSKQQRLQAQQEEILAAKIPATPPLPPEMPPLRLTREEQQAISSFDQRIHHWGPLRRIEIAQHLQTVVNAQGELAILKIRGIAQWLKDS